MTGIQEIQDSIFELEAELAGKHIELALAKGEKAVAHHYKHKMHEAIHARRAFRIAVGQDSDECFFDIAGQADRVVMQGIKK